MSKNLVGDNTFSPVEHSSSFMIWKFWDEQMGVKLSIRDVELGIDL